LLFLGNDQIDALAGLCLNGFQFPVFEFFVLVCLELVMEPGRNVDAVVMRKIELRSSTRSTTSPKCHKMSVDVTKLKPKRDARATKIIIKLFRFNVLMAFALQMPKFV
jgi:hypothetical protein